MAGFGGTVDIDLNGSEPVRVRYQVVEGGPHEAEWVPADEAIDPESASQHGLTFRQGNVRCTFHAGSREELLQLIDVASARLSARD